MRECVKFENLLSPTTYGCLRAQALEAESLGSKSWFDNSVSSVEFLSSL